MSKKIVLVTGAGAGIGRALCIGFAGDDYTVIGVGRNSETLRETKALIPSDEFSYFEADVSNSSAMAQVITDIFAQHKTLDIVINNAAVYPKKRFLEMSATDWDAVMNINVNAVANCCRLVLPRMLENGYGRILNVGSLADLNPSEFASAYCTSKGAVHALTRAIAEEIDSQTYPDVLVNEFLPSRTISKMSEIGAQPEAAYLPVKTLIDKPSGSASGKSYTPHREVLPNLGLKRLIKHAIKEKIQKLKGHQPLSG